jgi:hypothetical protein
VTGINLFFESFVLVSELFSVSNHTFNFFLGEATFIVCD